MDTPSQDRMDELSCAICLSLLCEPVLWPAAADAASPCRHVYCRHCIVRCILSPSGRSCPLCRAPATSTWIECADLPIEVDVQRQVMEQFPSEHAERQAEVAVEAKASGTQQVLLHTVHSNPLQLRPRKGSFFKLWLRSTDETLLMVAAALTTSSRSTPTQAYNPNPNTSPNPNPNPNPNPTLALTLTQAPRHLPRRAGGGGRGGLLRQRGGLRQARVH